MKAERSRFLAGLLVLGVALWLVDRWSRTDPGQRNFEVFTEMAYSKAYESFTPNPFFADGLTNQLLVPGVVIRGSRLFPFGDGPEEAQRAGELLRDPLPADAPGLLAEGAELFRIYCLVCHDVRGNGLGPAVQRGVLPPPSLHAARARELPDGALFHVLTRGQGNMASYAAQLSPRERWAVIRHLRRLQQEGPE